MVLDLYVDGSSGLVCDVAIAEDGDTTLGAVVVVLGPSSSEESPPARARSSASRSAIVSEV